LSKQSPVGCRSCVVYDYINGAERGKLFSGGFNRVSIGDIRLH